MHSFVLRLESKYVLRALGPCLAVCGIDMGKDMGNAIFEVGDGIAVGVEIASTVPLSIEIAITFEGVVAVDRNEELDAVAMRFHHEFIEATQNGVVPRCGYIALEAIKGINGSALGGFGLACVLC
jgi:hypothetical protein